MNITSLDAGLLLVLFSLSSIKLYCEFLYGTVCLSLSRTESYHHSPPPNESLDTSLETRSQF